MQSPSAASGRQLLHSPFVEGQDVDAFCVVTQDWLPARILSTTAEGFRLQYLGWGYLSCEHISPDKSVRLAARGSKAPEKWQKNDELQIRLLQGGNHDASTTATTRAGRTLSRRLRDDGEFVKRKKAKTQTYHEVEAMDAEDGRCAICGKVEDDFHTDLVECEGGCYIRYHVGCLGLESSPKNWKCELCRSGERVCFDCGQRGRMNAKGGVFKCSVGGCNKYFHQQCVDDHPLSRRFQHGKLLPLGVPKTGRARRYNSPFRCPRHECIFCMGNEGSKDFVYSCNCPVAYHPQCVPPSTHWNTIELLWEIGVRVLGAKIPSHKPHEQEESLDLALPELFLPQQEPDEDDPEDMHHFRLPEDMLHDVVAEDIRQACRPYY